IHAVYYDIGLMLEDRSNESGTLIGVGHRTEQIIIQCAAAFPGTDRLLATKECQVTPYKEVAPQINEFNMPKFPAQLRRQLAHFLLVERCYDYFFGLQLSRYLVGHLSPDQPRPAEDQYASVFGCSSHLIAGCRLHIAG